MVQAVRGAIQVKKDEPEDIKKGVLKMVRTVINDNELDNDDVISINFTVTGDLVSVNPATGLRTGGFSDIPLFCSAEPECKGMLPRMIRVIIYFNTEVKRKVKPVYLDGAEKLRPDLVS